MIEEIFVTALDSPDNCHYEIRLSKVARLIFLSPMQPSVSSCYGSYYIHCLKIASCSGFFR